MNRFAQVLAKKMTVKEALASLADQMKPLKSSKHPKDKALLKRLSKEVDDIIELEIPSPKVDAELEAEWLKERE